jgi:hypothetical protein
MIRVEAAPAEDHAGWFDWHISGGGLALRGKSRTPLFDACRSVQQAGGHDDDEIGLFRAHRSEFDVKTRVRLGAKLTVKEDRTSPRFAKFKP